MKGKYRLILCSLCLAVLLAVPATLLGESRTAYIKHSSGLVLGNDGGNAVIVDKADAVLLLIEDTDDGWLNLSVNTGNGTKRYLSKYGSWNTVYNGAGNTDNAKFRFEGDLEGYVRIVCKANDRCLGTDDTTAGSKVYSDKDGGDIKHQWFVTSDLDAEPDLTVSRFALDATNLLQTTEGWGVSLCWWANMCGKWDDEKIDELIDWLVSPEGLNYNIFRYNIGGGDDPDNAHCTPHHMGSGKGLRAEMEGFKDSSDDVYHWDRDAAQRKIMLKIKEKRPDAIFEAFSNTPPWYMTYSGCCSGSEDGSTDNLRPEYYEEFARYLVDVCVHYRDEYGIEFRTLEPFNESNSSYWHRSGAQEGCHFEFDTQIEIIKLLHPMLQQSGLTTVISASDETAVWPALFGFYAYRDAGILDLVGQWNTHTYWGSNDDRINYNKLVRGIGGKLWMSETGSGGSGIEGNLSMAQRLIDDIRYLKPDAWCDWQYMEELNDQWCLVRGSFADQTYKKVKNYYVRQHFSKYIKPGYTFIYTENEQTLAAISPDADTLVVTTINNLTMAKTISITLQNFNASPEIQAFVTNSRYNNAARDVASFDETGRLTYTVPMRGICTVVLTRGDNEGIADASADLMRWSVEGSTLNVNLASPCSIQVHNASGGLVYSGSKSVKVDLPKGVYLLSADDGRHHTTAKVAVK